jgi:hypothetical protein
MVTKKVITADIETKTAEETILRGSASIYYNVNGILLSKNKLDCILLVVPDKPLLEKLLENKNITIEELSMENPDFKYFNDLFKYGQNLSDNSWISLPENFCEGSKVEITLKDYDYPIEINSALLPLKLKKAEYGNISYRIFINPLVIGLKKDFGSVNPGFGFSMLRLFRVI